MFSPVVTIYWSLCWSLWVKAENIFYCLLIWGFEAIKLTRRFEGMYGFYIHCVFGDSAVEDEMPERERVGGFSRALFWILKTQWWPQWSLWLQLNLAVSWSATGHRWASAMFCALCVFCMSVRHVNSLLQGWVYKNRGKTGNQWWVGKRI